MKILYFCLFLLFRFTSYSQINVDFESGNFDAWLESSAGHWEVTNNNPINGLYSLHHAFDNSIASRDNISLPMESIDLSSEIIWRFQIKYGYNPSDDNTWGIFLMADNNANEMYPGGNINGYVLGVNYAGTSDLIKIWKITEGSSVQLLNTDFNWQENITSSGIAGIEVKRSGTGDWTVFIDADGDFDNLVQIGETVNDITYTISNYFGISYEYTLSADQLIWIDDVYIGSEVIDNLPPFLIKTIAVSNQSLLLNFNESVDLTSSQNISNYFIDDNIGYPETAVRDTNDHKNVILSYSQTFTNERIYNLNLSNISDLKDNTMNDTLVDFFYSQISVVQTIPISSNELAIYFNKEPDDLSACLLSNYFVDNNIGSPVSAAFDIENPLLIRLSLQNNFTADVPYTITIDDVKDTYGNVMNEQTIRFEYVLPEEFDIIVNEILCDINPVPNVLPSQKYIEIYNRTDHDLNLQSWTLQIGDNSPKIIHDKILASKEYAIICDDIAEYDFFTYGMTIPILNPSELTTTGKRIILRDDSGKIIEDVNYSKDWYDDEDRDNGGWSLERIDPSNFCGENENWTVTTDYYGGTPGYTNSVYRTNEDNISPQLIDYQMISSDYLILTFSKNINFYSGAEKENFTLNPGDSNPDTAFVNPVKRQEIHIKFNEQFSDKKEYILAIAGITDNCNNLADPSEIQFVYQLIHLKDLWIIDENKLKIKFSETVDLETACIEENFDCNNEIGYPTLAVRESSDTTYIYLNFINIFPDGKESILTISGIKDINGNLMKKDEMSFTYYLPKPTDIVINEILFNPYPEGSDFIELYNRSEFDIDMKNFSLGMRHLVYYDSLTDMSNLSQENLILKPKDYVVFTTDKKALVSEYISENDSMIFEIENLPNYPDEEGIITLLYKNKEIIDEFHYDKSMHFKLLDDPEGVSLERVNPDYQTQDINNWYSASENVGFATPAYRNSQFMESIDFESNRVLVEPFIFSPDYDGVDDFASIHYKFKQAGNVAHIMVLDSKGRPVKQLGNNLYLSTEGSLLWDGLYTDNRTAPPGTYIIWFKTFDLSGNIKLFKKPVVLAKKY